MSNTALSSGENGIISVGQNQRSVVKVKLDVKIKFKKHEQY